MENKSLELAASLGMFCHYREYVSPGESDISLLIIPLFNSGGRLASSGSNDEENYETSRYVPPLKETLTRMCQNVLSIEEYPSVMPLPESSVRSTGTAMSARRRSDASSLRGSTASKFRRSTAAAASDGKAGDAFTGERQLVFVVGGLCYSELRVARDVMSKESKEIIIGSTHFTKPTEFMRDVSKLSS